MRGESGPGWEILGSQRVAYNLRESLNVDEKVKNKMVLAISRMLSVLQYF